MRASEASSVVARGVMITVSSSTLIAPVSGTYPIKARIGDKESTNSMTVWVESFIPNSVSPIISKGDTTLTQLLLGVSSDSIGLAGESGLDGLTVPVRIPLRTRTKVAATGDGSVRKLCVNDALVGQDASPFVPPNHDGNPVKIGRHNHINGPFYFHGYIDEVRITRTLLPL